MHFLTTNVHHTITTPSYLAVVAVVDRISVVTTHHWKIDFRYSHNHGLIRTSIRPLYDPYHHFRHHYHTFGLYSDGLVPSTPAVLTTTTAMVVMVYD
jgi:hypothetical protein